VRRTLALFAVTVLQCLTDAVYIAPAVLAPLAVAAVVSSLRRSTRRRGIRLGLVAMATTAIVAALHAPYLRVAAANPHLIRQTNWHRDPRVFLQLPGGLLGELSPLAVPTVCLALIAVAAALAYARGFRGTPGEAVAIRHALLWVVVGLLMSLPLQVGWDGHVVTLPHLAALEQWPIAGRVLRLPERLRVSALMGATLLCGLAFAELVRQAQRHGRPLGVAARAGAAAAVAAVMYAQYARAIGQPAAYGAWVSTQYRVVPAPRTDSPVLQVLRAQGGPTLEVPLPRRRTRIANAHAPAMFRAIGHRQPVLNGYSSYWPAQFVARMTLAARLPDPDAVRALRETTGLAFVLVRIRAVENVDPSLERERAVWLDLVRQGGRPDLQLVAVDEDFALFRVSVAAVADDVKRLRYAR
jgi:hypothetical protein